MELERDWSYEKACDAHALLDALEDADARAREAAERGRGRE